MLRRELSPKPAALAVDLIFAEANFAEIDRFQIHKPKRKAYVFAEVGTPAKTLVFDVLVHKDIYPGSEPTLAIYDTAFDGVADVNDRARDIDRLDLSETIQMLGEGVSKFRTAQVPRYAKMLLHVLDQLKWDASMFRGYRCKIDYPLYGSQVAMMFDPPQPPGH